MKIKAFLSIGYANASREGTIEINDSELEGLTERQQEDVIHEYLETWSNNHIDLGYEIME